MTEITKGKATVSQGATTTSVVNGNIEICSMNSGIRRTNQANAELIAEAFNVTNETGFSPRQLADQKAELLEALETAAFDLRIRKQMEDNLTPIQSSILEIAEQAIKNSK